MKKIGILLLTLLLTIIFALHFITPEKSNPPEAVEGILDLRTWSFEKDGIVELKGEWEFYLNEWLDFEKLNSNNLYTSKIVRIPATKSSMANAGIPDDNYYYGTLRLRIMLPKGEDVYGLRNHFVLTAYKLYLDDKFVNEIGTVGENRETSSPMYKWSNVYFKPDYDEIQIIYQTSDFYFGDSAIVPPRLGLVEQVSFEARTALGRDLFLFGILLIMGLYHLSLYYMRRKDLSPLFFGIFCLSFGFRMLLVGERFAMNFIDVDFLIFAKLAYTCVFLGYSALCAFLYYTLKPIFAEWFIKISIAIGVVSCSILWILPFNFAHYILIGYALIGIPLLIYGLSRVGYGVYKDVEFALPVFLGFMFLSVTLVNDLIYEFTLENRPSLIPIGIAIFIFSQAYTLSSKFSIAFSHAEALFDENISIMEKLKHINANLESMVEDRTFELKRALEEMEIMSKTDYLTKLPNRRFMFQKITELINSQTPFYVGVADLDKFKIINDTFGHDKGDSILIDISKRMVEALDEKGFVGRWGGEEFLIIFYGASDKEVLELAENIRETVASKYNIAIKSAVTITIGICKYERESNLDLVIGSADKALYEGKISGRNQCRLNKLI